MKIKHFEHIWEEAEKVAKELFDEEYFKGDHPTLEVEIINSIQKHLSNDNKKRDFGIILFCLCYLSEKYNINTWTALTEMTEQYKVMMLEDD